MAFAAILVGLALVLGVAGLVLFLKQRAVWRSWDDCHLPFIGPYHPVFGQMHLHADVKTPQYIEQHRGFMRKHKLAYLIWVGPLYPYIMCCSAAAAKPILRSSVNIRKSLPYSYIERWLGLSVLTSTGAEWKRRRRLVTPAFHFAILKDYVDVYHKHGRVMLDKLREACNSGASDEGINLFTFITTCTLDIIGECAFGYDINSQNEDNEYIRAIYELSKLFREGVWEPSLILPRLMFGDWIYCNLTSHGRRWKQMCTIAQELPLRVIRERREAKERGEDSGIHTTTKSGKVYSDFLHVLLSSTYEDTGHSLSDTEIRDEVDTFMFEGHDTTSSGLVWTFYELCRHPDVQERVIEEVDSILGDRDGPSFDDLSKFSYLSNVIREVLRMHPPVPEIGRELTEDVMIEGNRIPAGAQVNVSTFLIHHNPLDWDRPECFLPDRWDRKSPNFSEHDPFAYIPFSAGPRNCVGQNFALNEEKTLIAMVMKHFRLSLADPDATIAPGIEVILRPIGGLQVTLHPR